ncbi:unnamed protein product [Gongylonema pulchrum]|uniref:SynN domain-containing protein n=1 Tax=Gongylonema pulchrum TaxID=637853 RepID=A0A183DAN7_9BILA|nr:unnamed protein product [Gongylonema pulchrum]
MFKGLKSKLEDEAKKLQATVSQYGENIAQQVRSGVSDTGSDASGHARRFFGITGSNPTQQQSPSPSPNLLGDEEVRKAFKYGSCLILTTFFYKLLQISLFIRILE